MSEEPVRYCFTRPEGSASVLAQKSIIEIDMDEIQETVSRLRNRNVAQLLEDLGDQPPCVVRSVKRQFTRFANDLTQEIEDAQKRQDRFNR